MGEGGVEGLLPVAVDNNVAGEKGIEHARHGEITAADVVTHWFTARHRHRHRRRCDDAGCHGADSAGRGERRERGPAILGVGDDQRAQRVAERGDDSRLPAGVDLDQIAQDTHGGGRRTGRRRFEGQRQSLDAG